MTATRLRLAAATAALAAASLALTGCVISLPIAAGPSDTSEFSVGDDVRGLRLEMAADVNVRLGDAPSLTIDAPRNVLDRLTVDEQDGILSIGTSGRSIAIGGARIDLTVTSFDSLELDGAGDVDADFSDADDVHILLRGVGSVTATGIDADTVSVHLDGAGEIDLDGTAERGELRISGTGDIRATELTLADATVDLDGAGEIELFATAAVDARTSGIGAITVHGGADVARQIEGIGTITEK